MAADAAETQAESKKVHHVFRLDGHVGVAIDDTMYAVLGTSVNRSIGGTDYSSPTYAGGKFVTFELGILNSSNKTRDISLSTASLIDSKGNEFSVSSEGQTALSMTGDKQAEFVLTQIHPGISKFVKIVFDVPEDENTFTLRIPASLLSGDTDGELPISI